MNFAVRAGQRKQPRFLSKIFPRSPGVALQQDRSARAIEIREFPAKNRLGRAVVKDIVESSVRESAREFRLRLHDVADGLRIKQFKGCPSPPLTVDDADG